MHRLFAHQPSWGKTNRHPSGLLINHHEVCETITGISLTIINGSSTSMTTINHINKNHWHHHEPWCFPPVSPSFKSIIRTIHGGYCWFFAIRNDFRNSAGHQSTPGPQHAPFSDGSRVISTSVAVRCHHEPTACPTVPWWIVRINWYPMLQITAYQWVYDICHTSTLLVRYDYGYTRSLCHISQWFYCNGIYQWLVTTSWPRHIGSRYFSYTGYGLYQIAYWWESPEFKDGSRVVVGDATPCTQEQMSSDEFTLRCPAC